MIADDIFLLFKIYKMYTNNKFCAYKNADDYTVKIKK